jgi:cytosine/adenosine deaminase-related metal-dependent hydrolase
VRYFSADLIVPVTSPSLRDGIIAVDDKGRINSLFRRGEAPVGQSEIAHLRGILCPGFVNTHCHLELSYLRGRIAPGTHLDGFISGVQIHKAKGTPYDEILDAITRAEQEMLREGIVATGDVANTAASFGTKEKQHMNYHTFVEVYGSGSAQAEKIFNKAYHLYEDAIAKGLVASMVPHAPYSVSRELFELLHAFAAKTSGIISMHHQESEDENRYFKSGDGPVKDRLQKLGIEAGIFHAPGKRPLQAIAPYLPENNTVLLVHNTVSKPFDIAFAIERFPDLWWCLCPNSNLYINGLLPDVNALREAGARITMGTDSLASNPRLSILEEMKTLSAKFPAVGIEEIIEWSSMNGALALGLADIMGSFEPGKCPGLVLIEQKVEEKVVLSKDSSVRRIL